MDFVDVSTIGLETSPVATALAGVRANEAHYLKNKFDHVVIVEPADSAAGARTVERVHRIPAEEREIVIASPPLEATSFHVERITFDYVVYESGLSTNVM